MFAWPAACTPHTLCFAWPNLTDVKVNRKCLCTLYTLYTVNFLHCKLCTLHTLYTAHFVHCILSTLYDVHTLYTLCALHKILLPSILELVRLRFRVWHDWVTMQDDGRWSGSYAGWWGSYAGWMMGFLCRMRGFLWRMMGFLCWVIVQLVPSWTLKSVSTPPPPPTTTNFLTSSRQPRRVKFNMEAYIYPTKRNLKNKFEVTWPPPPLQP